MKKLNSNNEILLNLYLINYKLYNHIHIKLNENKTIKSKLEFI